MTQPQPYRGVVSLILLIIAGVSVMAVITPYDVELTRWLSDNKIHGLDRFMGQTMFEAERIGGGDPAILYLAIVLFAYYLAWKKGTDSRLYRWRPQLGFILVSSAASAFIMVHSIKWVMGRARPDEVLNHGAPYSQWYEIGPHFITEGIYRGSFPSGHTAQVFVFITLAYVLINLPWGTTWTKLVGWLWGAASLLYTMLMGAARCMTLSHWLTDVVGALFMAWIITHIIYYWLLDVGRQNRFHEYYGLLPAEPLVWELRIGLYLLGIGGGTTLMLLGVRGIWLQAPLFYQLVGLAGLCMAILFLLLLMQLNRAVWNQYSSFQSS
jgi:membrane-associated phospholipid phosphatase